MLADPRPDPVNLFVFPSETNARYLLLIIAVAGTTLILADGVIGGVVLHQSYLLAFLAALGVTALVFFRAYQLARNDAQQRIESQNWQPFPPEQAGKKGRSFQAMDDYILNVVDQLPEVKASNPQFIWDEVSKGSDRPTGIAFGFGRHKFICLRKGLHSAFLKARHSPQFDAILLHELGHLENRDVNKTILSLTLGRAFFPVALILLGLLNLYVIGAIVQRMLDQGSLQPVWNGLPTVISINLKTGLLILLVDIILSSVLRVREFYADARARQWLGRPDAFFSLFAPKPNQACGSEEGIQPRSLPTFLQRWYGVLTAKHPTHKQRIQALQNPLELYRPSLEVAFISGLLSGLVLNSSIHFVGVGLSELSPLLAAMNQFAQGLTNLWLLRLMLIFFEALLVVVFIGLVMLLFRLGVLPVIATVGLQVQGAAFSDQVNSDESRFLTASKLTLLALILGFGFVVGCLLVPVPKTFSLLGVSPFGLILFVLLWAVTFGVWLFPLARLSGPLYGFHGGDHEPQRKRRFLTRFSAFALLPSFLTSSAAHVGFSVRQFDPETIPVDGLGWILGGLIMVGFFVQGGFWFLGGMVMKGRGWLKYPSCHNCGVLVRGTLTPSSVCLSCGVSLSEWMQLPPPIQMPSPPAPEPVATSAPPL